MNQNSVLSDEWSENVIIVDGDYIDSVAFNLTVNFERMIGRRIPKADMAHWLDCIALDGGVREGEHDTQVVFIHSKKNKVLKNFAPSDYEEELNGKAFKDNLGEFTMSSYPVEEITSTDDFLLEVMKTAANHKDVKRVMVIANTDNVEMIDLIKYDLRDADDEKRITVFAMQPIAGGNFRQEILGYSMLSALGIKSSEIK